MALCAQMDAGSANKDANIMDFFIYAELLLFYLIRCIYLLPPPLDPPELPLEPPPLKPPLEPPLVLYVGLLVVVGREVVVEGLVVVVDGLVDGVEGFDVVVDGLVVVGVEGEDGLVVVDGLVVDGDEGVEGVVGLVVVVVDGRVSGFDGRVVLVGVVLTDGLELPVFTVGLLEGLVGVVDG